MTPPPLEIRRFVPLSGNARTYTSYRPDSPELYANQRPSAEKAGQPMPACRSTKGSAGPASAPDVPRLIATVLIDHLLLICSVNASLTPSPERENEDGSAA